MIHVSGKRYVSRSKMFDDANHSRYNAMVSPHSATGASIIISPVHTVELRIKEHALVPKIQAGSPPPRR